MNYIEVKCVTGTTYQGFQISSKSEMPKSGKYYTFGHEIKDGVMGRKFTVYLANMRKGRKFYIKYDKEYDYTEKEEIY